MAINSNNSFYASPLNFAASLWRVSTGVIRFILCEKKTFRSKVIRSIASLSTKNLSADEMALLSEYQKQKLCSELRSRKQDYLVSVILPTWNRADTLTDAINSVLSQSYKNWELLVIDDGSEDGTDNIVTQISQSEGRVHYHRIDHSGVSAARNFGLERSKGDIIAYLDSDNTWDPDYLLIMSGALRDKDSCAYSVLKIIHRHEAGGCSYRRNKFQLKKLRQSNYIDLNVFVHKRELFVELGGFDTNLKRFVDWDLILRYTSRYTPSVVPIALCDYIVRPELDRISTNESPSYEMVVRNNHLIDWSALKNNRDRRRHNHVTIAIPVYNQPLFTENCIHSIMEKTRGYSFDVLIVDNRSSFITKATIWNLERAYALVHHIENDSNYFFALGNNMGVAASTGEYIVLLNNDTVVTEGWLDPLIDPLKNDPSIGVVGPRLLYPDRSLQAGGMAFSAKSKIPYHIYAGFDEDHPAINKQRYFQALTGACLAMRAGDFIQLGGFDPIFQNGCEDIDLCFRVTSTLRKKFCITRNR